MNQPRFPALVRVAPNARLGIGFSGGACQFAENATCQTRRDIEEPVKSLRLTVEMMEIMEDDSDVDEVQELDFVRVLTSSRV